MARIKVYMDALAIRGLMGQNFDFELYEEGRKDVRDAIDKGKDIEEMIAGTKRFLENGDFRNTKGASYWVGCLAELEFH